MVIGARNRCASSLGATSCALIGGSALGPASDQPAPISQSRAASATEVAIRAAATAGCRPCQPAVAFKQGGLSQRCH